MKKSRFAEEQIVFARKQAELVTPVPGVCRKLVSPMPRYTSLKKIRWDFSFRTEAYAAARRRKPSPEEAGCRSEPRQGHIAGRADKKELTLARLREWVRDLQTRYGAGERQVCYALQVSRSSFRYRSVASDDSALRLRIREVIETRAYQGYRRVHVMLKREGWRDNHKRI